MKYIFYAAYNEEFFPLVKDIFNKLDKEIGIQVYDPNNPFKLIESGVKVAIARGGTAMRIRKDLNIPVVEIPIPFEDMVDALVKASKLGKNIGVVGYKNLIEGFEKLNPMLNVNISQTFADNEKEMEEKILELKDMGIQVIVGGVAQTNIAKKLGLQYVRLDYTERALLEAYKEAELILKSILSSIRRSEELKAILDNTKEGYLAIDINGIITLMNRTSLELVPEYKSPIGQNLMDVFPELEELLNILQTGKESLQEIAYLKGTTVLYNMMPLKLDNKEIIGSIITFNDINTITKGEHKIRDKILSKGFYARYQFSNIHGKSKEIRNSISNALKFAKTDSTIMIIGETGVGKELFAQSIHNSSLRRDGPFVAVNCASLPESILESELFGYEEGAFTGAKKNGKPGLFELAHNGTIFLDEISEMPIGLQARFLRVLQEKRVMRLGSDQIIPVNVRIISATNKGMKDLVATNKFRDDLFYRLNVLTLVIPPLRERMEDIHELVKEFTSRFFKEKKTNLSEDAIRALELYGWPGNVRQLENFIEKLSVINTSENIDSNIVWNMINEFEPVFNPRDNYIGEDYLRNNSKSDITLGEIEEALRLSKGNRIMASNILGIHRTTLWRLMKKHKILE